MTFNKKEYLKKGRNCLSCKFFIDCESNKKDTDYVCHKWKKRKIDKVSLEDMFSDTTFHVADDHLDFVQVEHERDYDSMEVNLVKMMDHVFENDNPYPRDLKVDDRDIPEFNNIYEYFFDRRYGLAKNMQPFSRQLWMGMKLFSDYCPMCSDYNFVKAIENCPIDMRAEDFPDKVVFLNKGKCPKCKEHRLNFTKQGKMNFYRELIGVLGQRSGKSVSFSFFSGYHHHKFLKMGKPAELFTDLPNVTLTGTFTATDFKTAMETLWQPFVDVIDESPWFCVAKGSKVQMSDGKIKEIENIKVGDIVNTHDKPNEVIEVIDTGIQPCFDLILEDGKFITATAEHKIGCLSEDGKSLVWKKVEDITVEDFVIVSTEN